MRRREPRPAMRSPRSGATHPPTAIRETIPIWRSLSFSGLSHEIASRSRCSRLQRVQVRQEVLYVLRAQLLAVRRHFVAAQANDVGDPLVIGGQTAQRKIFVLEDSLEPRPLFAFRRIRLMTAVALGIVDFAAGRLLRI